MSTLFCPPFIAHYLLLTIYCPQSIAHNILPTIYCPQSIADNSLPTIYIAQYLLLIICCPPSYMAWIHHVLPTIFSINCIALFVLATIYCPPLLFSLLPSRYIPWWLECNALPLLVWQTRAKEWKSFTEVSKEYKIIIWKPALYWQFMEGPIPDIKN